MLEMKKKKCTYEDYWFESKYDGKCKLCGENYPVDADNVCDMCWQDEYNEDWA